MSIKVYRAQGDCGPMVGMSLSGEELNVVLLALISELSDTPRGPRYTILAAIVDSLQDLAIPMERERLVEELCTRLTRDRSAETQELVIEFSQRLGIQIPEVLA